MPDIEEDLDIEIADDDIRIDTYRSSGAGGQHINKTYNRIQKRDVIDTPKTENSDRTIDIPNFLKEEVQEYVKKRNGFPENQRIFPIEARPLQKRL